jgi:DNA repair protein RadC
MKDLKGNAVREVAVSYRAGETGFQIKESGDAHRVARMCFDENRIGYVEDFKILLLNRKHDVLGWADISRGGVAGTVVDAKVVFQHALVANASALILLHNHPSGNLQPSQADIALTVKLKKGGELLDIKVLDHLILVPNEGEYFSFADENLM